MRGEKGAQLSAKESGISNCGSAPVGSTSKLQLTRAQFAALESLELPHVACRTHTGGVKRARTAQTSQLKSRADRNPSGACSA